VDGTRAGFIAAAALLATGFYPLGRAAAANRGVALQHALAWTAAAWTAWTAAAAVRAFLPPADPQGLGMPWFYLALCLTAGAAVAVLGARRPGVAAWNLVVVALLAVLLLPAFNRLGDLRGLESPPLIFLAVLAAVGCLNYAATPLAAAVAPAGAACAAEIAVLGGWMERGDWEIVFLFMLAAAPWAGLVALRRGRPATDFDRVWLDFRNRFGGLWGLRVRDQFNRAAANAGWPVELRWGGLRPSKTSDDAPLKGLRALLKRFGPAESQ
jgi:hypothetical protein